MKAISIALLVMASLLLITVLVLGAVRIGSAVFADGPGGMMASGAGARGAWGGGGMFGGRGSMSWRTVEGVDSLESAEAAFEDYVDDLGYAGLTIAEVMEFEHNYYAIAVEESTGIGAMELLIDKERGIVGPEYGPNMMWNTKYGMHGNRGMMGGRGGMMGRVGDGEMRLTHAEAVGAAQRWLDENQPGTEPGEADAFYGYYTLHFTRDGRVAGMLSVHGESGDVWYHSWHGELLGELEHGEEM